MAGYTRQSETDIQATSVVKSKSFNDEFDEILAAMHATTGHKHDGTAAEGGPVTTMRDADGDTKIQVEESADEDKIRFDVGGTEQLIIQTNAILPVSTGTGTVDLGSGSAKFKDAYFSNDVDVGNDLTITNDVLLQSDAAALKFGANDEVTLTHVHDTGLLLNSTMALQFNDASQFINAPSATVLDINATDEIELNATLVDVNANLDVSGTGTIAGNTTVGGTLGVTGNSTVGGTLGVTGIATFTDDIIIGDGKTIGSTSDVDAMTIASNGQITLTQTLIGTALTLSGAIDVSGTTNLDVVDIDGAVQADATVTVGVNDTGYDVKFFGDTASAFMLWDASADDLILSGDAGLVVPDGQFTLGSTAVTADAGEINRLNGITAVVGELNALDLGDTAVGNAIASKAVILDGNKDYTGIRNLTLAGNLTVNGTTTTVNSTTVTLDDPVITLGGDTAPDSDDNKDRGVEFRYHDGSAARVGFFGWDDSATAFTFLTVATNSSEVFSGTAGNLAGIGTIGSGAITSTGAIQGTSFVVADGGNIGSVSDTDAVTIASGGGVTFSQGVTSTAASNTLGATGFNDANITAVGDIALDSISAAGTDIAVAVSDGSATALTIKQGSNAYLIIDTADSSESVSIGTGVSGTAVSIGHSVSTVTVNDNLTVTDTATFGSLSDGSVTIANFVNEAAGINSNDNDTTIPTSAAVKDLVSSSANVTGLSASGAQINTVAHPTTIASALDTGTAIAHNDAILIYDNSGSAPKYFDVDLLDTYYAGTTKTLTNKTLTAPVIVDNGIISDGTNELLRFQAIGDAVNELEISNASTGNGPTIGAAGETDVGINLTAKGTGVVNVTSNTDSSSSTTGALTVGGGLGVAADLFVGEDLDVAGDAVIDLTCLVTGVLTTTATQVATGGITSGSNIVSDTDSTDDLGATGARWANLYVDAITATDQITATGFTGTLDGVLGSGTAAAATVTTLTATGVVDITDTTDATDATGDTGALRTEGGASIAKKLYVGTDLDVTGAVVIDTTALVTGVLTTTDSAVFNGGFTSNGDTATFTSANANDPLVIIKNTTNDVNGARLQFVKDRGAAAADGDDVGTILFTGDNASQEQTNFASIVAEVSESANTDEAGKLSFFVAESNGTSSQLTAGLIIEGEHATDGEVDVTIGAAATSTTTIAGTLTMGSTAAMTNAGLLSVANQSNITGLSTITTGVWNGTAIASAYLDTDTAHLTTTQTFSGTKTFSAKITADAGIDIDNFNIDGTTIALSSGNMTLDGAADIVLDAAGGDVFLKVATATFGSLTKVGASNNLIIKSGTTTAATFAGANTTLAGTLGSGAITSTGNVTAFSDERLKSGVVTVPDALSKVESMRGVHYTRKDTGKYNTGVIAQEIQKIAPEVVLTADDELGTLSVDYGNITGYLIEAVKELSAKVKELEGKLDGSTG